MRTIEIVVVLGLSLAMALVAQGGQGTIYTKTVVEPTKVAPPTTSVGVSIEDAYEMCQKLAKIGFFVGQSSGAYMKVVHDVVDRIDEGVVVTVFSDLGERYFSTGLWGHH